MLRLLTTKKSVKIGFKKAKNRDIPLKNNFCRGGFWPMKHS
jgi:hypothetical protein